MSECDSTTPAVPVKRCTKCKCTKTLADFGTATESSDGKRWQCKACDHAYRESRRERSRRLNREYKKKNAEKVKAYNDANREVMRAYFKEYHIRNRERRTKMWAEWRTANRVQARIEEREYYQKNRDAIRAKGRQRYAKNPLQYLLWCHRRQARKRGLPDTFTKEQAEHAMRYWNNSCAVCGIPFGLITTETWDHWIPLTSDKCPGTVAANMVPLCASCNTSKKDREARLWLKEYVSPKRWKSIATQVEAFLLSVS